MKQLSIWAKLHVWSARLLIILLHTLLIVIAVYWAFLATENGWIISQSSLYVLISIYGSLYIVYAHQLAWRKFYWFRTMMHTILAIVSFLLVFVVAVTLNKPIARNHVMAASVIDPVSGGTYKHPEAEKLLELIKKGEIKKLTKTERKLLKSELKYQLKRYSEAKQNGQKKEAGNAWLTVLTIVLALIAFIGVGSIACNLSCNGNDGAAVLVLVLGTALVVFLAIVAFRGIKKRKKSGGTQKSETPS
jgi:amino acid transporter